MIEFTLTRTSTAPIEAVFDAMTDHRGIADYVWACRRSTLDREMLSGAPTRNHIGTIQLREADTGTEVSWNLRSTLKIPGVDRLMLPVFKKVIDEFLKGGITAAERRA
jgi:hypothetical protein